jgi:NADPH:quinone reductase-like Zn-dependent oxidoreductase
VLRRGERFDLILDVASTLWFDVCAPILTPKGEYLPIGHAHFGKATGRMGGNVVGSLPTFIGLMLKALMNAEKRRTFRLLPKPEAIAAFAELLASGQLTPIVSRRFPLAQVRDAMKAMEDTRIPGRIVLTP